MKVTAGHALSLLFVPLFTDGEVQRARQDDYRARDIRVPMWHRLDVRCELRDAKYYPSRVSSTGNCRRKREDWDAVEPVGIDGITDSLGMWGSGFAWRIHSGPMQA